MKLEDGYLTYVRSDEDGFAMLYLTSKKYEKYEDGSHSIWGDDWNDSPYEYNAGEPYDDYIKIVVEGNFMTPRSGLLNSDYSVESINDGEIAWLRSDYTDPKYSLMVNSQLKDIIKFLNDTEGTLYTEFNIKEILK